MAFGGILHLHPDTVLLMFSCGELGHSEFTMMVASHFMNGFIGHWTYLVSMFFVLRSTCFR